MVKDTNIFLYFNNLKCNYYVIISIALLIFKFYYVIINLLIS